MATLSELDGGPLVLIDVLDEADIPWRHIYGTTNFIEWLKSTLPSLEATTIGSQLTPLEQVFACFDEYAVGLPFDDDRRFKPLRRTPDLSVWEFKTDDIRIFGWIPCRDCFIAVFGDTKDNIEVKQLYGSYMAQTSFAREKLDLDEPKFVASKDYADVVSDKP